MKVQIKDLPRFTKHVTITCDEDIMKKGRELALEEIKKEVKIPGFRKGKATAEVLEKHVGADYVKAKTEIEAVNVAYGEALKQEKLDVIEAPRDLDITSDNPLTFSLKVAVMPSVKLDSGYTKIKVKAEKVEVKKKEVEDVITDTITRFTTYEADDAAKIVEGDRVTLDFKGMEPKDNTPLENTDAKDHRVIVGSGSLIPGFEDEMLGMKKGDAKDFEITFPKDYHHKPFANKKVKFHIEIKMVEPAKKPEINEEFTEKLRGKKMTKAEFEKDVEEMLLKEKQDAERMRQEDAYLDEAVKKYLKEDLPTVMVEQEQNVMFGEMKQRLANQGLKIEDYLAHMKKSEEEVKKEWEKDAIARTKKRFILGELVKHADVKVEDKDMDAEIEEIASRYENEEHKNQVKEIYKNNHEAQHNLKHRVELKKFFDTVLK